MADPTTSKATNTPVLAYVRVLLACIAFFMVGGVVFGFNALKPALMRLGLFAEGCTPKQLAEHNCPYQEEKLNNIIEFAGPAINLLMWPCGLACDLLGARYTVVVGALLTAAFGIATGFCLRPEYQDYLKFLFAGFAEFGVFLFMGFMTGCMQANNDDAMLGRFINTNVLFTILWDLSTFVFVIFERLDAYISLKWLFLINFSAGALLALVVAATLPDRRSKVHLAPLKFYIIPQMVHHMFFAASWLLGETYFTGTVRPVALWISHDSEKHADRMVDVFNYILPSLAPVSLTVITWLHKRTKQHLPVRFLVATAIGVVCLSINCIRLEGTMYFNYVMFVFWRIYTSAALYDSVVDAGFATFFGQFVGVSLSVGGAVGLTATYLEHLLDYTYRDNPRLLNVAQIPPMLVAGVLTALFFRAKWIRRSLTFLGLDAAGTEMAHRQSTSEEEQTLLHDEGDHSGSGSINSDQITSRNDEGDHGGSGSINSDQITSRTASDKTNERQPLLDVR